MQNIKLKGTSNPNKLIIELRIKNKDDAIIPPTKKSDFNILCNVIFSALYVCNKYFLASSNLRILNFFN